jgi:excisionase family DNA binding protein
LDSFSLNGTPADSRDEFLTVAEVAQLLRLDQQTVRNWIDQGSLRAIRVGARRVRIRRADLDAFLMEASAPDATNGAQLAPEAEAQSASDGRAELEQVLDRARAALDSGGDHELAEALRDLAETASRLARAVEQRTN